MLAPGRKRNKPTALMLADSARDARDWPAAARHYAEALRQEPRRAAIWVQYGHALKESGNLAEAEKVYREALEVDDSIADTHLQLGHALKLQGRQEDAVAAYLRAFALDPTLRQAGAEVLNLCWQRIGEMETGWRQHLPAFLNAVASVSAFAHEQARLLREIEELRRQVELLEKQKAG